MALDHVWNVFIHYIRNKGGWRGVDYELPALDGSDGVDELTAAVQSRLGFSSGVADDELPGRETE